MKLRSLAKNRVSHNLPIYSDIRELVVQYCGGKFVFEECLLALPSLPSTLTPSFRSPPPSLYSNLAFPQTYSRMPFPLLQSPLPQTPLSGKILRF